MRRMLSRRRGRVGRRSEEVLSNLMAACSMHCEIGRCMIEAVCWEGHIRRATEILLTIKQIIGVGRTVQCIACIAKEFQSK